MKILFGADLAPVDGMPRGPGFDGGGGRGAAAGGIIAGLPAGSGPGEF